MQTTDPRDWYQFYTDHGTETLALAEQLLGAKDEDSIQLGLAVVARAYDEAEAENPDSEPALHAHDFTRFVAPALQALSAEKHELLALEALWVCAREGADMRSVESTALEHLLSNKERVGDTGIAANEMALDILVHAACQSGTQTALLDLIKAHKSLEEELFAELSVWSASSYNKTPFLAPAIEGLHAQSEGRVRGAIDVLWNLLSAGADVSSAIPFLVENQTKLTGFTAASDVIACYYLKTKQYEVLDAWLADADTKKRANAYRGIFHAAKFNKSADEYLALTGTIDALRAVAQSDHSLPDIISYGIAGLAEDNKPMDPLEAYGYRRDSELVYYSFTNAVIPGADPKTFEVMLFASKEFTGFAKDKTHVWHKEKLLEGADQATFFVSEDSIHAKDAHHVWTMDLQSGELHLDPALSPDQIN